MLINKKLVITFQVKEIPFEGNQCMLIAPVGPGVLVQPIGVYIVSITIVIVSL